VDALSRSMTSSVSALYLTYGVFGSVIFIVESLLTSFKLRLASSQTKP
jgi:hypothetical protein